MGISQAELECASLALFSPCFRLVFADFPILFATGACNLSVRYNIEILWFCVVAFLEKGTYNLEKQMLRTAVVRWLIVVVQKKSVTPHSRPKSYISRRHRRFPGATAQNHI